MSQWISTFEQHSPVDALSYQTQSFNQPTVCDHLPPRDWRQIKQLKLTNVNNTLKHSTNRLLSFVIPFYLHVVYVHVQSRCTMYRIVIIANMISLGFKKVFPNLMTKILTNFYWNDPLPILTMTF